MKCPSCGFENMPGTAFCGRCRAQLQMTGPVPPEAIMPPRAGAKKRFRRLSYLLNRMAEQTPAWRISTRIREIPARFSLPDVSIPAHDARAMLFSLVPGLGHALTRRFKEGAWFFLSWIAALAGLLHFIAGGFLSALFFAAVIGIHAGAICHAGRVHAESMLQWARTMSGILMITGGMYFTGHFVLHQHVGFVSASTDLPSLEAQTGDTLIFRKQSMETNDLFQNRWIVFQIIRGRLDAFQINGYHYSINLADVAVGQILGLPGDQVVIGPEGIFVNDLFYPAGDLPVGQLSFPDKEIVMSIPKGRVFVIAPVSYFNKWHLNTIWRQTFIIDPKRIKGVITGIWSPFTRIPF